MISIQLFIITIIIPNQRLFLCNEEGITANLLHRSSNKNLIFPRKTIFIYEIFIYQNSFADIARLLSDFFRDLDVVPSDVVAGLVLLRKFQKIERELIVKQRKNDTYEFLSGVPVTPRTKFLSLTEDGDLGHFQLAIHYMHFALAAYGWPMFLVNHSTGLCQLCTR